MSADDDMTKPQQPSGPPEGSSLALFTDLYQLTMLQAYFEERMTERAVFSLFVRRLPPNRNFLIACGLDTVLDYLESLRFNQQDLAYLESLGMFSEPLLDMALPHLTFTGDLLTPSVRALHAFANVARSSRSRPPCPKPS